MRAVHGELERWGRWIEAHAHFQGYPSANILETFIGSDGGNVPGHRVLMLEMPIGIYATHRRVVQLSDLLRETVELWYVVRMKDDGTLWSMEEKCARLRISPATLRLRLHRAKLRIAGVSPPCSDEINQVVSVAV